ncbi:MAG TPA: hypothetical protein VHS06_12470 [Chloroflexota bacterium]|nr:hypothetical protein [Chloroflexota bacterium]
MNEKPLEGKVAQILNERELVINIGSAAGVIRGMRFAVLAATPVDVKDPDTGDVIDVVDRAKTHVEATEVRERITICGTYHRRYVGGSIQQVLKEMEQFSGWQRQTFRIGDGGLPKPIDPTESYVKIGDRVKLVIEPNEE